MQICKQMECGTHGRKWHTDEQNNIAFSFFIKLNCNINKLEGITLKIAQILIDIINTKYKIKLLIKKPNDIVYANKKIGGILTQTKVISGKVQNLIVGIGINTNKTKFPEEIKEIATSIKKQFNIEIDNQYIITEFCNQFEKYITKITTNKTM